MRSLHVRAMPLTDYATAWRWQQDTARAVRDGAPEALALLQHPPVYTFGRRARPEHLLLSRDRLQARGAEVIETNRGGAVTFHGPGQLVGYPILDLRRRCLGPAEYVRLLEATLIGALESYNVEASRSLGRPGVWTAGGKIAAIGVRIEQGVSLHGFALNVDVDLAWFDAIVPCGLADATVTSMSRELGLVPTLQDVSKTVAEAFAAVFDTSTQSDAIGGQATRDRQPAA